MFASRKALNTNIHLTNLRIEELNKRYWALWHRHELLLKHLGLTETVSPEKRQLTQSAIRGGN